MSDTTDRLTAILYAELKREDVAALEGVALEKLSDLMLRWTNLIMDEQQTRLTREKETLAALITAAKRGKGITDH